MYPNSLINQSNKLDTEDVFGNDLKKKMKKEKKVPIMKIALVRPGAIFEKANNDNSNAGYDLKAFNMTIEDGYIKFMLGIKSEAPEGYYWEVVHKSSNSKFNSILANTKGTIDGNFRGEWQARLKIIPQVQMFKSLDGSNQIYIQQTIGTQYIQLWQEGEIALQAILHKEPKHKIQFVDQSQLSETQRKGGFGSTGNGLDGFTIHALEPTGTVTNIE